MSPRRIRGRGSPRPWNDPVNRRWAVRVLAVVLGAFLVGYLLTAVLFFPNTGADRVATVPDIRGLSADDAQRELRRGGLDLEVGDSLPSTDVPAGRVVAQSPLPGGEVAPDSPVRVILSSGPERRAIPVLSSLTRDQALRVLEASGFQVVLDSVQDLREAGRVVRVEPRPGTAVPLPATVRVTISTGPPMVEVPPLLGFREEQLEQILGDAGLALGELRYRYSSRAEESVVVEQDPPAGDSIPEGSSVDVRISTRRLPGIIRGGP